MGANPSITGFIICHMAIEILFVGLEESALINLRLL